MPEYTYSATTKGYLPLHCFQCASARAHEVLAVTSRKVVFGVKRAKVPYGDVCKCTTCALTSPITPEEALVATPEPPEDLEAAAREIFGESNEIEHWKHELENIKLGLGNNDSRFNLIGHVYNAVSNHMHMPKCITTPVKRVSGKNQGFCWIVGALAIVLINFTFFSIHATNTSDVIGSTTATSVGMIIGWSIILAAAFGHGRNKRDEVMSQRKDMMRRLAQALAPLEPTGHELAGARKLADQMQWWTLIIEPHDLLIAIRKRNKSAPETSREKGAA